MQGTALHDVLAQTGRYETAPDASRPLSARLFGWSDLWFYGRVAGVIADASRLARRGRYSPDAWRDTSVRIFRAVEHCGGRITIEGMLPAARFPGPKVYTSNHMGMLETLLYPGILLSLGGLCVVVKQSLNNYPVFGHVMRAVDPVSVTRENPREDFKTVLAKGTEAIRQGRSVLIFPQHTRSPVFDPSDFNSLAVKLARRANAPVVPIAIQTDFMGLGKRMKDFGHIDRSRPVRFSFGEPIPVEGHEKKVHEQCVRFIVDRLKKWGCAVVERSEEEGGV